MEGRKEVVLDNFDVIETAQGNDCQMFGSGWCIEAACPQRGFASRSSGFDGLMVDRAGSPRASFGRKKTKSQLSAGVDAMGSGC
jgi:hypothetical protein